MGLSSLEAALRQLGDEVTAEIHCQPFELNPQMPREGQEIVEHLTQKYGITPEQVKQNQEAIRARGREVGFEFAADRNRIYNTFDTHRLLHWAGIEGRQLPLKHALLDAYFNKGENPGSHDVLTRVAGEVGLDAERAREVLATGLYADEVRKQERFYMEQGIRSVPSFIIDQRYLIQGGQPPEAFEQTLRQIAQETAPS